MFFTFMTKMRRLDNRIYRSSLYSYCTSVQSVPGMLNSYFYYLRTSDDAGTRVAGGTSTRYSVQHSTGSTVSFLE